MNRPTARALGLEHVEPLGSGDDARNRIEFRMCGDCSGRPRGWLANAILRRSRAFL